MTTMDTGGVDAHQHFWRRGESHQSWRGPEHDVLDRSFLPEDLRPEMAAVGVTQTVLVQSVNTVAENERLLAYAAQVDFVLGVVSWLPLQDVAVAGPMLEELVAHPAVRGVRCLIGRDPIDWLLEPAALRLLERAAAAGLAVDVVPVTDDQVRVIGQVAERIPDLTVVIDHLGRPPVDTGGWLPWAEKMRRLAQSPSVAVKVSVGIDALTAWGPWRPTDLDPYVGWVVEQFGYGRLMLASNWPVIGLRTSHRRAWSDLADAVRRTGAGPAELAQVRGDVARRCYAGSRT